MSLRVVSVFLLAVILTSACLARISSTPTQEVNRPYFEATECWGTFSSGVDAACGYVIVPEDRSQPYDETNSVRLAVTVLRIKDVQYTQPPTFLLGGGPGQDVVRMFAGLVQDYQYLIENGFPEEQYEGHARDMQEFKRVMDLFFNDLHKREFVLFDQRGAGYSLPSLKCHGADWDDCRARLIASGVDIAAYNTVESVEDVNDIRLALSYEKINLQGGSYGTRLALEVLRRYPEIVRAVVLDGVAPPQIDWGVEMVKRYDDALDVLFDHCTADERCNTAYPELESVFYDLLVRLNNHPIEVTIGDSVAVLNGNDLRDTVWNGLYDASAIRYLPLLIHEVSNGDPEIWGQLLAARSKGQSEETIAWGMHYSTDCAERWVFQSPADLAAAAEGLHPAIREGVANSFINTFRVCEVWSVPAAPAYVHTPVSSEIPTLLVSGEFDPGTPPAFAELAAQTLTHHYNVVFPYLGHTDGFTSSCHASVLSAFLDDPYHAPDTTCFAEMDNPPFVIQ
jgi:pimeloyl-ACP methyl ester carboxylesterase